MIVPIKGNVGFTITLDPTVWIFDDRKIELDQAFSNNSETQTEEDGVKNASERWDRELHSDMLKPPVNRSIKRFEREKILKSTYVMPIKWFLETAEVNAGATEVELKLIDGSIIIPLKTLTEAYFLFAVEGKPLKEDGPVHLIFGDGSNINDPIKGVKEIYVK
ncbi:uncharacterized protein JNUCC1_00058 [Lentibacillus sp. JNUCC-1]|nr:hypothetical protein [Lentibacillus sp. JNUCC-1]MUV36257.1 uncharacterized protein [Lentibacillus sp. JNUCC-1]